MFVYILLIMLPIMVQHLKIEGSCIKVTSVGKYYQAMRLFWGLLFFFLILRHEDVGRDLRNYKNIFNMISSGSWEYAIERSPEIGYNLLNKLISMFTNEFRWIIIITAFLGICFVAKAYLKYTEDATLTISLFVIMSNFLMLFSGLKQSIAISLGLLAFECVRRKKIIGFLGIVICAMLFHTSAFMLIFMYPLYYIRITRMRIIFVIPLIGVLWIYNKQVFSYLSAILMQYTEYEAEITSTGAVTMLILFALLSIFSYIIPEEQVLDNDTLGMRNFMLFAVILQMFAPLHTLAMRMNYYYMIYIPLLIPKVIKYRSVRWKQVAVLARYIMIAFFLIYFFSSAPKDNVMDTFPYKFFWEGI